MAEGLRIEAPGQRAAVSQRTAVSKDRSPRSRVHALQRGVGNRVVQRMLGHGRTIADTEVEPIEAPDLSQRFAVEPGLQQRLQAQRGLGAPLDAGTRARMETGFGADLGAVRLHTGPAAHELSGALQARAFTHGSDIYFGGGAYQPSSRGGQHLLAHELTHVMQQSHSTGVQARLEVGAANDAWERAADRAADRVLRGETVDSTGPALSSDAAIQRAFITAVVVRNNVGVHKSNRKDVANGRAGRLTVESGGLFGGGIKARLARGTLVEIDRTQTVGNYVLVRYQAGNGVKLGYVNNAKVKTYAELGQSENWDQTGLSRQFLTEHATDLPQNDTVFHNHQPQAINTETNIFLGHVGVNNTDLFDDRPPSGDLVVPEHLDAPMTGVTAPETLTEAQERFLAGFVNEEAIAAREAYARGFIVRYQSFPQRFHDLIRQGQVLWTLDSDGILSIGSPYNSKHAVVAGGKDVYAAGEAHLKTGHEHGLEAGELTQTQLNLWGDYHRTLGEIRGWEQLGGEERQIGVLQRENQARVRAMGGQNVLNRINELSEQLAPGGEDPLVVLDFGSGHYAPRKAWSRATTVWQNAGFRVEWDRTSQWV